MRQYLTTPIYYVNGDPHVGHAYTSVLGDALRRITLMTGGEAFLSTGTDEHGQKNQEAAEKSGLAADEFLERQARRFRALFDRLDVRYDLFVRTTSSAHKTAVEEALRRLWDKDLIIRKLYRGLYCVGCEQFKKAKDLDPQGRCPDHLIVPTESEETNYFLRLAPYQEWLMELLELNDGLIDPPFYRGEVLAMLREPLEDLSISRPKSRVRLGVELPFDREYVAYVWFDALLNYIGNLGWPSDTPEFRLWWPAATHLMAKDIVKTHCIYWPIILRALGLEPPAGYRIHGYWVGEGGVKMSKSLGNVVEPNALIDRVGVDGLRYYLLRSMGSSDSPISDSLVVQAYNTDLANNIGNLFARVLRFAANEGRVPSPDSVYDEDAAILEWIARGAATALKGATLSAVPQLARTLIEMSTRLNSHVEVVAPWKLARTPGGGPRLDSAIYVLMECLRILAQLAWPIMPATSSSALQMLGASPLKEEPRLHDFLGSTLPKGAPIGAVGPLFPRIATD